MALSPPPNDYQPQQDPNPEFVPLAGEPSPFLPSPGWHAGGGESVSLKGFRSEADLTQRVLDRLTPWFHVDREVWGRHPTGSRCRIDAIVTPRTPELWKNPDIALGIEFKALDTNPHYQSGRKELTAWVAQAIDYSQVEWPKHGRICTFLCPDPFADLRKEDGILTDPAAHFAEGLLGQFGVGFLTLYRGTGLSFLLHTNHTVWSERYGSQAGRRWTLRRHTGRRH
ncbi:hypothetical protein [Embleya sp. NPDC020886]|uniref:hypothetical protein n=1 Tax=Embleya sp. NPDC020886 TaxID=3363980 RepID=UPI0037BA8013